MPVIFYLHLTKGIPELCSLEFENALFCTSKDKEALFNVAYIELLLRHNIIFLTDYCSCILGICPYIRP